MDIQNEIRSRISSDPRRAARKSSRASNATRNTRRNTAKYFRESAACGATENHGASPSFSDKTTRVSISISAWKCISKTGGVQAACDTFVALSSSKDIVLPTILEPSPRVFRQSFTFACKISFPSSTVRKKKRYSVFGFDSWNCLADTIDKSLQWFVRIFLTLPKVQVSIYITFEGPNFVLYVGWIGSDL